MATGVCGINCDVCRLYVPGLCSSCGPGNSMEAQIKLATMERVLGSPCPILSCAVVNHISYCTRDCSQFPCENFSARDYPFPRAYLYMQKRRREKPVLQLDPMGKPVVVPDEFWLDFQKKGSEPGQCISD